MRDGMYSNGGGRRSGARVTLRGWALYLQLVVVRPVRLVHGPQQQQQHQKNCDDLPGEERNQYAAHARAQAARKLNVWDVVGL